MVSQLSPVDTFGLHYSIVKYAQHKVHGVWVPQLARRLGYQTGR